MIGITVVCVGRLGEKHYTQAADEYVKRLGAYCSADVIELPEARVSQNPSDAEIDAKLRAERDAILRRIPKTASVIALCVEGDAIDSEGLSKLISDEGSRGVSKLCFLVGSSHGLHEDVKKRADYRISMSRMTFPHTLARVMLLEQIYRGFKIAQGGKYHK
jgi:23S rRNA (pseudouridine1915-N3)-methyltransferase